MLAFYNERLAQESYLRTARERISLQELGRLIGYRLRPGVAAETYARVRARAAAGRAGGGVDGSRARRRR